ASWSDTATLTVKRAPVSVKLDKLDSYYVTSLHVPSELSYTVSNDSATVKYTIQKSGQAVSEMKTPATAGVIPFSAGKPSGLKEVYTVTVYARNDDDEEWSVDSLLLTVYNEDILDVVVADVAPGAIGGTTGGTGDSMNGKTITMNNANKVQGYVNESGYQLSFEDFTALRTDISLQKVISANYGAGVWGMLSDRIKWESDDPELVSVDYEQGGLYSDIRNYSYTSYAPATDFLLVGKGDTADSVTIKATHANTGMEASIKVNAKTLKDHLYLFQFYPKTTTTVIYKNGDGVRRQLTSNEQGELAVYEESGIASDVQTMSTYPDPDNESLMDTYVGTLLRKHLDSGERDVASLQLYACNNLRLRRINKVTLVFRNTDGMAYNGDVTIHGGVYKNDLYCPVATIKTDRAGEAHSGIDGVTGTAANGKLDLYFDPSTFRYDSGDEQALPGDNITYVLEYTTEDCRPGIAVIYSYSDVTGLVRDSNAVAQLTKLSGSSSSPQIITQSMQQYYSENGNAVPMSYARDVLTYTEPLGLSRQVSQVMLTSEVALTNEPVEKDSNGYSTFSGEKAYSFALCKPDGKELTDAAAEGGVQPRNTYAAATQITDLKDFAGSTLYVFPFSTFAVARGSYTMDDASLTADGITDGGSEASFSTENSQSGAMVALYYGDEITKSEKMPYIISNLSHQPDVTASVKESGTEIKSNVRSKADIGSIFSSIDVNDMIKKGVIFLGGLTGKAGDKMMNMLILPTEDPASFQIMVFIGYNKRAQEPEEGKLNVEFDPDQMYDDIDKFDEAMSDMFKDEDDDDDDDDDEGGGEASVKFNFYGTLTLDAHLGIKDGNWDIRFAGGDIGTNFAIGYEWSQNFMCGPVPVFVSFEVGAHADLELGFASIDDVREMLLDAAMGVSIEAFAGLGFDMSLIAFQLGIFGKISADVNFLYLTRSDQSGSITSNNGTKLDIAGEIGLRMKVKFLCITYSKTFCSTGFNWSKTWGKYNQILDAWESGSSAEIKGVTANGRAYKMMLTPTGAAMITIDGEGELENRDYLDDGMRLWNVGFPSVKGLFKSVGSGANALTDVQSNAYPYANPVFTDDGEMFLYLSDNNNAEERQSVISYAVKNGIGYTDCGHLDVSDEVLSDSSISASGTGNSLFTTWVKQEQMPVKEKSDTTASFDELGLMLNSTEIYAGAYNGSEWNVTRLTDNFNADMAPVVASSGDHAIVTWRNLDASQMPEYGTDMDLTAMFNVENTIRYRIYNGSKWTDAQVAYNGATGTVNAIDAAMLPNGTALLTYTVRTGEELTSTETFYTVINSTGKVLTTVRLTNDNAIDTNAKVAALGDQFVLGWYSEQSAVKEDGSSTHDVRLARVNANGSVDADFPESIGGEVSPIGSDFRFTQPAGNSDLSKLSIIWSQAASGDDDGKYELDAVRFYQQNGAVGVTAPAQISLTDKGFKIDHFDAYTDSEDTIHTLILGSDYTNIVGLDVYDSIDLSNLPISTSNSADPSADHLDILAQETLSSIKLGSGSFAPADIEVSGDANLKDLMLGLNLPVQFSVKNTGLSKVDTITVSGATNKEFTNLNLLPNETKTLVVSYPVPENSVQDVTFEITPEGGDTKTVNLTLNRPDVGIAGMKLMREELGQRDIQVTLANTTGIPLQGSGKIVKLGLYKDSVHTQQLDLITISDDSDLSDIDAGYYAAVRTLNVRDLIGSASEIPDSGVSVYAHAWVESGDGEKVDELNPHDNDNSIFFHGLLTKNNGEKVTNDIQFEKTDDGYVVYATIRNNSLQTQLAGSPSAVLYDSEGNVIAQKELTLDRSTLSGEEQISSEPLTFTADEVSGTPARAAFSTVSYIENGEEKTVDKYKVLSSLSTFSITDLRGCKV
ncbi:MAG: hypothetical protein II163_00195, partial [Ruminococcus sp.]|nr:hypothetical protein [Ruminococcus sp.]